MSDHALAVAIRLSTAELRAITLMAKLKGLAKIAPEVDDKAKRPSTVVCPGFPAGCQNGGTFGYSAAVRIDGQLYCWDCAMKFLGIEGLPYDEQIDTISRLDPSLRKRLNVAVSQKASTGRGKGWRRYLRDSGEWDRKTAVRVRSQ